MTAENTKTFADVVLQQENPTTREADTQFDLPGNSLFRDVAQDVMGPQGSQNPGAVQLAYRSFSKVFILWRPWQTCTRCQDEISDAENTDAALPSSGDYTCPHVQVADFKAIRDRILAGEAVREREDFFSLADESRCVHILWLEPDPTSLRKLNKMERVRKQMSNIHPHIPNKASG